MRLLLYDVPHLQQLSSMNIFAEFHEIWCINSIIQKFESEEICCATAGLENN